MAGYAIAAAFTFFLKLLRAGATNGEIARRLWITQQTVKFHVSNVYRKLDVANRTEACNYAHVNCMFLPDNRIQSISALCGGGLRQLGRVGLGRE